jgi:hypothetical protein
MEGPSEVVMGERSRSVVERSMKQTAHGIADAAPRELAARIEQVTKHLAAIDGLLADAQVLQDRERKSAVRLRGADEVAALGAVLRYASVRAEMFGSLAEDDEGVDPTRFETDLLAARLENAQALAALEGSIEALRQKVADCALYTATLVKPPVLAAYKIAKAVGKHDPHRGLLVPAFNFYKGATAKATRTKRARAAASSRR